MLKRAALLAVAGILTLGSSLPVLAADEEIIEPAGYHVYDSTEDSETDTWYGIARGTYLKSGHPVSQRKIQHMRCVAEILQHIGNVTESMYEFIWTRVTPQHMEAGERSITGPVRQQMLLMRLYLVVLTR